MKYLCYLIHPLEEAVSNGSEFGIFIDILSGEKQILKHNNCLSDKCVGYAYKANLNHYIYFFRYDYGYILMYKDQVYKLHSGCVEYNFKPGVLSKSSLSMNIDDRTINISFYDYRSWIKLIFGCLSSKLETEAAAWRHFIHTYKIEVGKEQCASLFEFISVPAFVVEKIKSNSKRAE